MYIYREYFSEKEKIPYICRWFGIIHVISYQFIAPASNAFLDRFSYSAFFEDRTLAVASDKALQPLADISDVDQALLEQLVVLDHVPGRPGIEESLTRLFAHDDPMGDFVLPFFTCDAGIEVCR